ncbi:hypothetical protein KC19_1G008400 [Ceratodon purpureus]|uniref:Uncharacterized protein n=1 Tax=Ceratodon purpureus TaxID=3225 RepID=A0A8T0J2F6_CERPU|nr:hypothetical protein KC19_1G008400 [Ceratodon purpureus]
MALPGPLTGSNSSPTFSTSERDSSLYDSADSSSVVHSAAVPRSHSSWPTGVRKMAFGRGDGVDPFPARRVHSDDMGPGFPYTPRPNQPAYDDYARDNAEDDFADDLLLGEYDAHNVRSQQEDEAQHVRDSSDERTFWDRDVNFGNVAPRGGTAEQSAHRRGNAGYASRTQGYGHENAMANDQRNTQSMSRGGLVDHQSAVPWRVTVEDQNKRRRIQRQWTKPYLSEMASAHAERRSPVVHVPTTTTGKAESEQMVALRSLGPQKSNSLGSNGPASTSPALSQGGRGPCSSSIPSAVSGMGESSLRASSSARDTSTRGSAPSPSGGHELTPISWNGQPTPEYTRRPAPLHGTTVDTDRSRSGDSTRISALETRVVDLASQVTQNLAMVEEVLHTQRDFKGILMQLLNASTCVETAERNASMGGGGRTVSPSLDKAPSESLPQRLVSNNPNDEDAQQPSWMSAETVLLTPNTRNTLRPRSARDIGMAAVSTDVSDQSIANGSVNTSAGPVEGSAPQSNSSAPPRDEAPSAVTEVITHGDPPTLLDPHQTIPVVQVMATRGRGIPLEVECAGVDRLVHDPSLQFPPRSGNEAIAVNKFCYITHPDTGDIVVAEGKTGGSWKAKGSRYGNLCNVGEQMVQIHRVFLPDLRLLHIEDRQSFRTTSDAVVKANHSNVYVKWDAKYIHKKV